MFPPPRPLPTPTPIRIFFSFQIWILCRNSLTRELKIRIVGFALKKLFTHCPTLCKWTLFCISSLLTVCYTVLVSVSNNHVSDEELISIRNLQNDSILIIQSALVISTSVISNNRLPRKENLNLVLTQKSKTKLQNIVEKRKNCSWGAISPLFHNIFNIYFPLNESNYTVICKIWLFKLIFPPILQI